MTYPADRGLPPRPERSADTANGRPIEQEPDTFVLYRIIGNDLPPRHAFGQSRQNLAFILEHEPDLPGCEKRFVVNRIVDAQEERQVLELLEQAGRPYLHIPFSREAYRRTDWDVEGVPVEYAPWTAGFDALSEAEQGRVLMRLYRHKNNYVMNNNGARNAALRDGKQRAKWVLPWDGNCFVTASAWSEITAAVRAAPALQYFVVPMARVTDNAQLLRNDTRLDANEEPQIIFRKDAALEFDPRYYYGHRPKVELLWRLGVPGAWDRWSLEPWDLPCPPFAAEAGAYGTAGWVARLFSGRAHLEEGAVGRARGVARAQGIKRLLDDLDADISGAPVGSAAAFIAVDPPSRPQDGALLELLREAADDARLRDPSNVAGNDRERSSRRDTTGGCLQRVFDDVLVLCLAWQHGRDERYAEQAVRLVRSWLLDAEDAKRSRRRWPHRSDGCPSGGAIQMKGVCYFLDAVRVLVNAGRLADRDCAALQEWFGRYLHWLQTSERGRRERAAAGSRGTWYDLQCVSIGVFLGETQVVRDRLRDCRSRLLHQIDPTGAQHEELKRRNSAHGCCFNLQGWIHLAQLAESLGDDLWSFESADGRGIRKATEWLLQYTDRPWPYSQTDRFDHERLYPIYYAYRARYGVTCTAEGIPAPRDIKPVFSPNDGIMPFWQLAPGYER
ncbi:MAG TPA: alginate lyase family protein [Pseudomonadales bacterium]